MNERNVCSQSATKAASTSLAICSRRCSKSAGTLPFSIAGSLPVALETARPLGLLDTRQRGRRGPLPETA